ncbi:OTU domain-containing protein 6B [Borealophlyctis nickersoniae]|nr:OTU domain-containing protein 6B [Borealophlyctis nickersoniae]
MKKSVGKGAADKKKKKEMQEQIALMEREMNQRHEKELELAEQQEKPSEVVENSTENEITDAVDDLTLTDSPASGLGKKKPNKQKLRKERKAAQFEEMRKQAEEEAANTVNYKERESEAIAQLLEPMSLKIKQIPPDGHCLYNAVAHQVTLHDEGPVKSYKELRHAAAEFMRNHPDDFMPFLVNDQGDGYTPDEYKEYCDRVENTALWGGQLEIQALSRALNRPIHVVQMGSPLLKIGEDLPAKPLIVSYHKHAYGLGEHYNSLIPVGQD